MTSSTASLPQDIINNTTNSTTSINTNNNSISSPPPPPPPYSKAPPTKFSSSSSETTLNELQQHPPRNSHPSSTSSTVSIHDLINKEDVDFNHSLSLSPTSTSTNKHPLVSTVSMVAKHPIVKNAVKYYETSKRNYPSFNYAANIVEAAAFPVVNKIELNLNQRHQIRKESLQDDEMDIYSDNKQTEFPKKRRFSNASNASKESVSSTVDVKKRLQFCIHILKLANSNISSKIDYLQGKLTEMAVKEEDDNQLKPQKSNDSTILQPECQKTKTEIVGTVKKIINLTTQYHADDDVKNSIKNIILALPETVKEQAVKTSENEKIFVFANESLEMIRKLTSVFSVQLNKVEDWVSPNSEVEKDEIMKEEQEIDSSSTRCSSEEPDGLSTATKRMRISEAIN